MAKFEKASPAKLLLLSPGQRRVTFVESWADLSFSIVLTIDFCSLGMSVKKVSFCY